ncbi:threonine aldolase [Malaciobacter molluscorum LMG 25693]|uniref:L-threonine aldolase n=1 Tax=Malaciobacter molluscorum LMG 25693 TaxID=870501 RepID=A0A2G1DER2_9BACT|nr:low specificity L-threonine aldolase [Malaciobacter molluscorum]AXX93521.1 low specificity L-threonine aldolase [Malaciobacter molluscorum LMG 25693]PHO16981.1 threonine aldolase [Malaciobacter molluscorum LMG 25693]RXJ93810.1 threonine aldolase [Malaciobacter molluscorum]
MYEKINEQFASDNYSQICPEVLKKIIELNNDNALAYGNDYYTKYAADKLRELFETDCEIFFVFTGTAANSLSLAALCSSYHSIICTDVAHIETDECGAPEFFSNGSKLLLAEEKNGKLTPEDIIHLATKRTDIHYPKPKVISITQSTELGTVYTIEELKQIQKVAKEYNLYIQMDGARFANAVASLKCKPADITWKVGVDVLCFSGTKNGMAMGEVIVFFNKELAQDFDYRCKQAGQLASKMKFISAQWLGLLENDLWRKNATHANNMAKYFEEQISDIKNIKIKFPVESNSVFIEAPAQILEQLKQRDWIFYGFIGLGGGRFVFAWNTSKKRVDELVKDLKELSNS